MRYTDCWGKTVSVFNQTEFDNHENVVFCADEKTGLKAIIAVHSTKLGPAVGGCRLWQYNNDEEAIYDVLRLSKGMTYKNAVAGLPFGGGKSVIIGDAKTIKTEALFKAFGRHLEKLGGAYYSAEDVNITCDDVAIMNTETDYVLGLEGKSGNPSPFTALGTFLGIKAAYQYMHGHQNLAGVKVAVQGLGAVAYTLCQYLHDAGAELFVTDINQASVERVVSDFNAIAVGVDDIYDLDVDVYAPCALGATINDDTLARLKAKIIAGCANNQLAEPRHGELLREKGILYAPDYVINAGGIINVYHETAKNGYNAENSKKHVEKIYDTLSEIFTRSEKEQKSTHVIADQLAEEILAKGV